jgi:hypothetical protein
MDIKKVQYSDIILTPHSERRMTILKKIEYKIETKYDGVIRVDVDEEFVTDGRSGGKIIDFLLPHFGNKKYAAAVILHDALFASKLISIELANEIFEFMLKEAGIGKIRRRLAIRAVSSFIGENAYETQDKYDDININKVSINWDAN